MKNLFIINDPVESMVQLATERISTVHSEEAFQETIISVEEVSLLADGFEREIFTKRQLSDVVMKTLEA